MHILKSLRTKSGMLQKEVAAKIGVDRTSYVRYERGDIEPNLAVLEKLAELFNVSVDYLLGREEQKTAHGGNWIPVLGDVRAGLPMEAVENILDYEEISSEMATHGEHFALRIKGNSMEPQMKEGDVVIVRKQEDVESGNLAIVMVNGDEATIKRVRKQPDGIMLIPFNPAYEPIFYSEEQCAELPVRILGRVVELRAKW